MGGRPGQTGRCNPRPQLRSSGPAFCRPRAPTGQDGDCALRTCCTRATAACAQCVGRRAGPRTVVRAGWARGAGPVSWTACRSAVEALPQQAEGNRESGWVAPRGQGCVDADSQTVRGQLDNRSSVVRMAGGRGGREKPGFPGTSHLRGNWLVFAGFDSLLQEFVLMRSSPPSPTFQMER